MNIGKSIKIALIQKDMRAKDLAEKMEVSGAYISMLSNSKKPVSMKRMETIAAAFDYQVSEFIALGED